MSRSQSACRRRGQQFLGLWNTIQSERRPDYRLQHKRSRGGGGRQPTITANSHGPYWETLQSFPRDSAAFLAIRTAFRDRARLPGGDCHGGKATRSSGRQPAQGATTVTLPLRLARAEILRAIALADFWPPLIQMLR